MCKPSREENWSYLDSNWSSSKVVCAKIFTLFRHPRSSKLGVCGTLLHCLFLKSPLAISSSGALGKRTWRFKCHSDAIWSTCGAAQLTTLWSMCGLAWLTAKPPQQMRSRLCGVEFEGCRKQTHLISEWLFLQPEILTFIGLFFQLMEKSLKRLWLTLASIKICHCGKEDPWSSKGWAYQWHNSEFQPLIWKKGTRYGDPITSSSGSQWCGEEPLACEELQEVHLSLLGGRTLTVERKQAKKEEGKGWGARAGTGLLQILLKYDLAPLQEKINMRCKNTVQESCFDFPFLYGSKAA